MKIIPKKVLITGATEGIGFASAKLLLQEGHRVFICARQGNNLNVALEELSNISSPSNIEGIQCDVREFSQVENMIDNAVGFLGGLDTLVNNAGVSTVASIEELTLVEWKNMIDTNLSGVFHCSKAAVTELKKSTNPNIINLGSRAGRYAFPGGVGYNASKAGLQGFSEALFLDLRQYGIGVTLLAPGIVSTNLSGIDGGGLEAEDIARVISDILKHHRRANVNWVEIRPGLQKN